MDLLERCYTNRCLLYVHRAFYLLPSWTKDHLIFFSLTFTATLLSKLVEAALSCMALTLTKSVCPSCLRFTWSSLSPWHCFLRLLRVSRLPFPVLSLVTTVLDLCPSALCTLLDTSALEMPLVYRAHLSIERFPSLSVQLLFLVYSR
jgi:hypothetical protein